MSLHPTFLLLNPVGCVAHRSAVAKVQAHIWPIWQMLFDFLQVPRSPGDMLPSIPASILPVQHFVVLLLCKLVVRQTHAVCSGVHEWLRHWSAVSCGSTAHSHASAKHPGVARRYALWMLIFVSNRSFNGGLFDCMHALVISPARPPHTKMVHMGLGMLRGWELIEMMS